MTIIGIILLLIGVGWDNAGGLAQLFFYGGMIVIGIGIVRRRSANKEGT